MAKDIVIPKVDGTTKKLRSVIDYSKPKEKPPTEWDNFVKKVQGWFPKRKPKSGGHQRLTIFTRQFATLLDAGIALTVCFDSFQDERDPVHRAIEQVGLKVQSGYKLSQAMRTCPHIFSPIYCGLVESGERTGQLVPVLHKLADDLEKELTMRKKLQAALTYPAVLLVAAVLCVSWFVTVVLPCLEPMFTSMHIQLPFATRVLLHSKEIFLWCLGISSVLGVIGYFAYRVIQADADRLRRLHWALLYIPMFGNLYKMVTITRILQSMATMLDVGITVVPCLKACETLTNNTYLSYQVSEVKKLVIDGETMGESLMRVPLFPRSATQLIAVGEESSDLVEMIQFAGRLLTEDCDAVIDQLAANMEPVIMLIMGFVVGFIVMGAMLPIVQLIQNL